MCRNLIISNITLKYIKSQCIIKNKLTCNCFFNGIKNNKFIDTIEQESKEIGWGFNKVDCCFLGDL